VGSGLPHAGIKAGAGEGPALGQPPLPGSPPSWDTPLLPLPRQEWEEEAAVGLPVPAHTHSKVVWISIGGKALSLTDKTLVPQKPGLPKTRADLFIHHLHLTFSMLFSEKKKEKKKLG